MQREKIIQELSAWLASQQASMTEQLITWCEINSGSLNLSGLAQMAQCLWLDFSLLQAKSESFPLSSYQQINALGQVEEQPLGNLLSFVKRPEAPIQILLCGHMDTVYPADSTFQHCSYKDTHTLKGPGVADMKGGLMVILYALQAYELFSPIKKIGWRVVINSDEELSSPGSAALLQAWAKQYDYGLVYEPALNAEGLLAGERKGSGNFSLIIRGQAAHVGRAFNAGKNAIVAAAKLIENLHALNEANKNIILNVGQIHGGGALNIVPDLAVVKLNIRLTEATDEAWFRQQIKILMQEIEQQYGVSIELHGQISRPPKKIDDRQKSFYELLKKVGKEQGLDLAWQATGGCCDGNNLAAAGLVNIDTLGVRGGAIHSEDEFVLLNSLPERAELTARLLLALEEKQ